MNTRIVERFTPLQAQAWSNDVPALRRFFEPTQRSRGMPGTHPIPVELQAQDEDDPQDLMSLAVRAGHLATVNLLIDVGVQPVEGMHRVGSVEVAQRLKQTFDWPDAPARRHGPDHGPTLLSDCLRSAVENLQPTMVRYWLDQGVDPKAYDRRGRTPLHALLTRSWLTNEVPEGQRHDEGAPLSDEHGALNVAQAGSDGGPDPALDEAALIPPNQALLRPLMHKVVPIVDLLVTHEGVLDGFDQHSETPLLSAMAPSRTSFERWVRLVGAHRLVQAGADVNVMGVNGSVLWCAMGLRGMQISARLGATPETIGLDTLAQALIERGTRLHQPTMVQRVRQGETERQVMVRHMQNPAILGSLPDRTSTVMMRAVRSRSMVMVEHALALGADIMADGDYETLAGTSQVVATPMMIAVHMGWNEGIDRLAQAFDERGLSLNDELQRQTWASAAMLNAPGRSRLETLMLRASAEEVLGSTGASPARGRPRL